MKKRDFVHCNLDKNFFKNVFERERKKMGKKMGVDLTHKQFTKILEIKKVQFKFPKLNTNNPLMPKRRMKRIISRTRR